MDRLKLDKTPTSAEEANQFELQKIQLKNKYQLDTLVKKQGLLGKITGSVEPAFNVAMLIAVICLLIDVIIIILMSSEGSDIYLKALGIMVAPVTTIIGYILGQNNKS